MFGKKNEPKVKEPSPREIAEKRIKEDVNRITIEVEQLAPGQTLIYKLPEFYWSGFAAFLMAELNPVYPQKGRKYIMSTDRIADGKPAGQKTRVWESNKSRAFAEWVAERNGVRFI